MRTIKGEHAGCDLRVAHTATDTGELVAVQPGAPVPVDDDTDEPPGQPEGGFHRVREAATERLVRLHDQTIDDDFNGVLLLLVQDDVLAEVDQTAVDPRTDVPAPPHVEELFPILALSAPHDRREDLELRSNGQALNGVHHLLNGLGGDRIAAMEAMRMSDPGKQQPQVVIDLGHRPDRRARIVAGALLLDGDGGGEPLDGIHVRLSHLLQELARIGRQRLHVPPLPLGEDRVEREGGLARAAQARDYHELVPRNLEIEILQVVLTRPFDDDRVAHKSADYITGGNLAWRSCDGMSGNQVTS